MLTHY